MESEIVVKVGGRRYKFEFVADPNIYRLALARDLSDREWEQLYARMLRCGLMGSIVRRGKQFEVRAIYVD